MADAPTIDWALRDLAVGQVIGYRGPYGNSSVCRSVGPCEMLTCAEA